MKPKKSSQEAIFNVLRQISYTKLFKKYSSGDYSYNKISINNLIFNENCLVVAKFKDFLIYDDNTEFIHKFYTNKDVKQRLTKILIFYEKYSKIFPNYLVLKENKYLYRNIRKKQKMIDAFNEIKREEKENRKILKIKEKDKKNELNELFSKKVKNEIKTFQKNISFKNYKNSFDSDKNNDDTLMINQNSISLYYKQFQDDKNNDIDNDNNNLDSFITNQTNGSISNIVNILNDNKIYIKDLPNILTRNNNKDNQKKNKSKKAKDTKDIIIKNKKNKNIQRKNNNSKSIKIINDSSNKDENLTAKHIKNNSQTDLKKMTEKNNLYKYAITSSNATNSSSMISKKIKNHQTSSSINKISKENKENKNNNSQSNKENNNNNNNSSKNMIITKVNAMNSNKNIYQKTTPNFGKEGLSKHFYKTNNNFKRATLNKSSHKNIKENNQKNNDEIKKNNKKYTIKKEVIKKKYIKAKHASQDFDSNLIYKMTENILNNKNLINSNTNNTINTENNYKNFLTNENPNLITGDTKPNERNEKNFMEDKVLVNVRDIIKQEKEKETKNKKIFYTAQKSKNNLFKITKNKQSEKDSTKTLKFYKTKKNYLNTIDNNNLNYKKNIDKIKTNDNDSKIYTDNNIRNNSAFTKQKTEQKLINKKLMTKEQKTKTKIIFTKNKIKNTDNKKQFIYSSENFNKSKKFFNKKADLDAVDKKNNNNQINKSQKLYEIKCEPNLLSPTYEHKNKSERRMKKTLSYMNNKKNYSQNLTPKAKSKELNHFLTKNNFSKTNKKIHLNNSAKFSNENLDKKYKTVIIKNKNRFKNEACHNSQKNLLSINILNRIKEVKENKTKNDFYRTAKLKNSIKNNSNNIKTPVLKDKKMNYFKNRVNKKLKNDKGNKTKEDMMQNYMSSFSIKVNKTNYNKEKINKNKNLKKTWTKNMKNIVSQINNNITNEKKINKKKNI